MTKDVRLEVSEEQHEWLTELKSIAVLPAPRDGVSCLVNHDDQNTIEVVEADQSNVMPSTRLRRQDSDRVEQLLSEIEDAADGETADKVRNLMLTD